MKLGVLGGTFDPIHFGHLRLAVEAREQLGLNKVILEVAAVSPLKEEAPWADGDTRLEMLRLALGDDGHLVPGTKELARSGPSYTIDTVAAYVAEGHEVVCIVGADALASLREWREPERLLTLARMATAARPGWDVGQALAELPQDWASRVDVFRMPLLDISSSDIRRRVAEGRSIRYLVPERVAHLIEERRLYQ